MYFKKEIKEQVKERTTKVIKSYKNDKGKTIVIEKMNGSHLLNSYTKYLERMLDGEFSKYQGRVNALKFEIAQRLLKK